MKKQYFLMIFITLVVLCFILMLLLIYPFTRPDFCRNMSDGSMRCFDSVGEWISTATNGEVTIPEGMSELDAIPTYNVWVATYSATMGFTPAPSTPLPNGATGDPTKEQEFIETIQYFTIQTRNAPQPLPFLSSTPES